MVIRPMSQFHPDMTVEQFSNAMEAAITGTGEGQLGISGSSFGFDSTKGQIIFDQMGKLVKCL